MSSMFALSMAVALMCLTCTAAITEFVALGPAGGRPRPANETDPSVVAFTAASTVMKWLQLDYEANASSAKDIKGKFVTSKTPELGHWFDLDLSKGGGAGLALTAKIHENKMYAMVEKDSTPSGAGGGCCADTLRIYDRDSANVTELNMEAIFSSIFPSSIKFHHATHTFDIQPSADGVIAYMQVQYDDPKLEDVQVNSIVAFNTATGKVVHTMDGDAYFSLPDNIGTTSTKFADTIFKVQYEKQSYGEEWHGNGVLLFAALSGTKLMAVTHRQDREAVIMKDPFSYKAADGGGAILQRFGTPGFVASTSDASASEHHFGIPASSEVWTGGCHNLFYTRSSPTSKLKGKETLSLFVNSMAGQSFSFAYEFELKLTEQKPGVTYTDTVFQTDYVRAECGFKAMAMGGARIIADGVFVVASGIPKGQMEIVDVGGHHEDFPYGSMVDATLQPPGMGTGLYDPFIRVLHQA